jgi:hypothetical protein
MHRKSLRIGVAIFTAAAVLSALFRSAGADPPPATSAARAPAPEGHLRCGWFDNPSPGNATLTDRDGEWTVAMQGMFSAKGKWPSFKAPNWVRTGNGSAGYGCACLRVNENTDQQRIVQIVSSQVKPLSACRRDKKLKEPENPLKRS